MNATWIDPRQGGAGTWHLTPARDGLRLTLLGTLVVCLLSALAFLGVLQVGRQVMCATHKTTAGHGALTYCSDYMGAQR